MLFLIDHARPLTSDLLLFFPFSQILPEHRGRRTSKKPLQVKTPSCSSLFWFPPLNVMHVSSSSSSSVSTLGLFPRRCLTCGLKDGCSFYDADVDPEAQHAVLHCRGQRSKVGGRRMFDVGSSDSVFPPQVPGFQPCCC